MYTLKQKKKAVDYYYANGESILETVKELEYPSIQALRDWVNVPESHLFTKRQKQKRFTLETKLSAIKRCYQDGEDLRTVAAEIGAASSGVICLWKSQALEKGLITLTTKYDREIKEKYEIQKPPTELEALKNANEDLQMQVAVLKETIEAIKKDPGVDTKRLRNHEKVVIVDALKSQYPLPVLLKLLKLSRSSYYYQKAQAKKPDKYLDPRQTICLAFNTNRQAYGYRRIAVCLKNLGIRLSEKVIRRIMNEEKLFPQRARRRKYSSYLGEISAGMPNLIERNFSSDRPNEKWLTDISEFLIPEGSVYLSPIIDCYDGLVVSWSIGESPDAKLVNSSLTQAISKLSGEKPIIHSDRGCHYFWHEWIKLMDKFQLRRSMSKKGCSPDNAACEGFFGRLKNECFYGRDFKGYSRTQFIAYIDEYIHWYNDERIKISLGGLSPRKHRLAMGFAN